MKSSIISTTADSISSGGTITGDLTISGDLTVSGDSSGSYSEIVTDAIQITKDTDAEFVSLILVNESDAASTAGIVSQRFDLEDTGGTAVDSGKILVGKEASFTATASTQDSYMAFHTSLNGTLAEKVRIDSDGNLGIGTASPGAMLEVSGGEPTFNLQESDAGTHEKNWRHVVAGDSYYFQGANDTYDSNYNIFQATRSGTTVSSFTFGSSTNVGIGGTPTAAKLEIHGGSYTTSLLIKGAAGNSGIKFVDSSGNTDGYIYADGENIGFLDIDGEWAFMADANTSAEMRVNNAIKFKVDANSKISLSNNDSGTGGTDSSSGNTLFGYQCGAAIGSGANNNTLFGHNAGENLTHGDECTAVGLAALAACTKGDYSVAVGASALGSQNIATESVSGNVAVGWAAGYENETGTNNTYVGYRAGYGGTGNESLNVGIGKDAMLSVTNGTGNTVVGGLAGDALTTGLNNVFLGREAGTGTANVDKAVIIGYGAGAGVLTANADGIVAIGASALAACTTGADNIAIGENALTGHTTGGANIAIGDGALKGTAGDSSGAPDSSHNIAVGYNALGGDWTDATASNYNVAIGGESQDGALNGALGNVSVGYDGLGANVSGDYNVGLGHNSANVITTGSNNTILGANSDPSANSATNQATVGYGVTGVADNSVTLGDANVTAVYMAQDSGATVYSEAIYLRKDTADTTEQLLTLRNDGGGANSGTKISMQEGGTVNGRIQTTYDSGWKMKLGSAGGLDELTLHGGLVGIGDASPDAHLKVENTAINTTSTYYGIYANHKKTLGATDNGDHFYGIRSDINFDDDSGLDSYFGNLTGLHLEAICTDAVGEASTIYGVRSSAQLVVGDVDNIHGSYILTDIDGGTVDSGVNGLYIDVDLESASTVGGEVVACNMLVDCDEDPGSTVTGYGMNMQTNADFMAKWYDGANSTIRFQVTAAGQVDAEGSINASQSLDYAEYFESKDGKEIAIGTTVKLDGEKIVACSDGDTPLGVIRPKSAQCIVGGSQSFHWSEKYMKDDYGADIWEDYTLTNWSEEITFEEYIKRGKDETGGSIGGFIRDKRVDGIKAVLDDNGKELEPAVPDTYFREHKYHSDRLPDGLTAPDNAKTITPAKQRQKLNPDYDESKTYKSREERDEWHVVGLLGQIPVTKGQPVSDNWIKMKDVSGTVEMYFVK